VRRKGSVNEDRRQGEYRDDDGPESVPIDPEGEQRELEAGGWERVEVQGKTFWVNPESGHRYPQGPAVRRLRQQHGEGE
jgi:hypothetical protein